MTSTVRNMHSKRHQLRKLRGETAYVDASPAVVHLYTLLGAGWSLRSISGVSGVSATSLSRIRRGEQATAAPATLAKILAVRPDQVPNRTNNPAAEPFVPRIGTTRRLQALQYMGWTTPYLREHYGIQPATLYQQGLWVTRTTHDKVATAYRELSHKQGPSDRTRARARRAGYVSPADWDDIDLDAMPDEEAS